ncbi:hypothetical protein [Primorskyibacter sp. S87]|uniref:hypothetical protein n=1 Tax=Primorskyibacter sp. S87 TaxID=3415126 RepID=UPI003C7BA5F1
MIDLSGADDGLGIRGAHPVDGGVDLVIGDVLAVAHDHRLAFLIGFPPLPAAPSQPHRSEAWQYISDGFSRLFQK